MNTVLLLGDLSKDPELRYSASGKAMLLMRLATPVSYRREDGETVERTDWHNVVAWGSLAEKSYPHIRKGLRIFVEGRMSSHRREDRTYHNVVAYRIVYDKQAESVS